MNKQLAQVNAYVIEKSNDRREESKAIQDPFAKDYDSGEVIEPPYDLYQLSSIIEMSNILPQCIEAMEQNCEGFGYSLVSIVPKEMSESLKKEVMSERERINSFFECCNFDKSFGKLRKKLRKDYESFGNSYLEVLRRGDGQVDGFEHLKSITMRLGKLSESIEIKIKKKKSDGLGFEEVDHRRRFRTYLQIIGDEKVYFKEFGDPRKIDATTGKEINEKNNSSFLEATEVIHLSNESVKSTYGLPRWIGNIASVSGSRSIEEINVNYLNNKAIPPLIFLISGGTVNAETIERLKEHINEKIKGKGNFDNIMILEAQGASSPHSLDESKVKIEMKELSQISEARFLEYDDSNRKKIRSSFRLPPIFVGLSEDYTRATAKESKEIAEEQVFGPEKDDFDFMINRKIFPDLDVKYHIFETKSAPIENRKDQAEIIKEMGESGLTIREVRKLLDKIADVELQEIESDWLDIPIALAPYLINKQDEPVLKENENKEKAFDAKELIRGLQKVRDSIRKNDYVS